MLLLTCALSGRAISRHTQHIRLNGNALSDMSLKARAKQIAYIPQHAEVDGELSVEQIVRLGRTPHRRALQGLSPADEAAIEDAIRLMQLSGLRKRQWQQLSGGERQRSQIARALAQQPQILLLDEPTNHLDIQYQLELMRLIARLPLTVVNALHDLNLAANDCQHLVLLKSGRVITNGEPGKVLTAARIEEAWSVKANVRREENTIGISYVMV